MKTMMTTINAQKHQPMQQSRIIDFVSSMDLVKYQHYNIYYA